MCRTFNCQRWILLIQRAILRPLILTLTIGLAPALAADPYAVGVVFEIDAPDVTELWQPAERARVASELGAHFIDILNAQFRPWSFIEGGAGQRVSIVYRVSSRAAFGDTVVSFVFRDTSGEDQSFGADAVWLEPGQLVGLGPLEPRAASGRIKAALETLMTDKFKTINEGLRARVPIGAYPANIAASDIWRKNPVSGDIELVLPLAWDRFSRYKVSRFRVACEMPEVELMHLTVIGRGRKVPFATDSRTPRTDAIVGKPVERIVDDQHLPIGSSDEAIIKKLKLNEVFLQEDVRPSPWETPSQ